MRYRGREERGVGIDRREAWIMIREAMLSLEERGPCHPPRGQPRDMSRSIREEREG